jgi:hypothetical protein
MRVAGPDLAFLFVLLFASQGRTADNHHVDEYGHEYGEYGTDGTFPDTLGHLVADRVWAKAQSYFDGTINSPAPTIEPNPVQTTRAASR